MKYSSGHTLVIAFYDDLDPETKKKVYKNKLVRLRRVAGSKRCR